MAIDAEILYGSLWQLGSEQPIIGETIPAGAMQRLTELGIVAGDGGDVELTAFGWRCYSAMEAGDGVPEFEREPGPHAPQWAGKRV